jgi:hypothetical protein
VGVYRGRIGHVILVVIIVALVCGREKVLLLQLLRICRMRQCRAMGERGGWAVMLSKAGKLEGCLRGVVGRAHGFMGLSDPQRHTINVYDMTGVHFRIDILQTVK